MDTSTNWASYRIPHLHYLRLGVNQLIFNSKVTLDNGIGAAIALFYNLRALDISGFTFDGRLGAGQHESLCREHDPLFSDERQPWEGDQIQYPPPDSFGSWMLASALRLKFKNELTLPPALTRLYANDFGGLFVKYSCLEKKTDFVNNLKFVDLSGAAIEHLECSDSGLVSVTEFTIGQVGLKTYNPSYFSLSSMPMLRKLDLHGNELGAFIDMLYKRGALFGVSGIQNLDMSANGIMFMNAEILYGLENVTVLNFSGNSLYGWNARIASLEQLKVLDLSSNQISAISTILMAEFDAHGTQVPDFVVNLSFNPFVCACSNIDLLDWLTKTRVVQGVTSCSYDGYPRKLSFLFLLELRWRCFGMIETMIVLSALPLVLVPTVLYACKWRIRFMYYRCRRLCRREGRPWLAGATGVYVSYHESDASVARKLRAYVESRVEMLTIVTRSSVTLGHYELEQMAALIDDCSVSIILISPESLNDSKFEFEFFMASEKGPHSILPVITTESFELSRLPRALRKLLISNSYLRLPSDLRRDASGEIEGLSDPCFQKFLIIFESSLLNIIERQTIRILRNVPNEAQQQPDVSDNWGNDEKRPLLT